MTNFRSNIPALTRGLMHIVERIPEQGPPAGGVRGASDPRKLHAEIERFCIMLQQLDSLRSREVRVISDMGDFGLYLLGNLKGVLHRLALEEARQALDHHIIALTLWVADNGGRVCELETVVNAFAGCANRLREPSELRPLCAAMGDVIRCVDPGARAVEDTASPWRLLNINRGIVATRCHDPDVMEETFELLVQNVPEHAPEFFREGLEQMELSDYPQKVRDVMERYHNRCCGPPTLH